MLAPKAVQGEQAIQGMFSHSRVFRTAQQLIRALDIGRECWTSKDERRCPWLFRGHASAKWRLTPSAWRTEGEQARVMVRVRSLLSPDPGWAWGPESSLQQQAEATLLERFADTANRLGLAVPGQLELLREDPSCNLPDIAAHPVVALAQHHQVPTRLLDFTLDPLVALYWAATDPWTPRALAFPYMAVVAVNPQCFDRTGLQEIRNTPRALTPNLLAQDGIFVRFGRGTLENALHKGLPLPSMDALLDEKPDAIRRLLLPTSQRSEVIRLLEIRNSTPARIRPGFDTVRETVLNPYYRLGSLD